MNDNIRRYAIALGVGIVFALAQRICFHDPAIEVARDVSVACAQAREFNLRRIEEEISLKLGKDTAPDVTVALYTSTGRIGCVYSVRGDAARIRAVEAAVLSELSQAAGNTDVAADKALTCDHRNPLTKLLSR